MSQVAVVGSINMDLVAWADRLPLPGETILGQRFDTIPGGKGANQAVAAARLGCAVAMIGRLGDDNLGAQLRHSLKDYGVDASMVLTSAATSSGVALIAVSGAGDNSIIVVPGANGQVTTADVEAAGDVIRAARVLLVQLEIPLPAVERAMALARAAGVTVVLDPAPAQPLPPELLALADVVVPNEFEAETLTGCKTDTVAGATAAAEVLCRHARAAMVKLGGRGVVTLVDGTALHLRAYAVPVVDTTAAGDAFAGGLAAGLLQGFDLVQAARFASAVGALSTTRPGAQPAMPTRSEVEQFLRQASGGAQETSGPA